MSLAILLRLVWNWNIQNVIYRNKRATKQNKTKKPTHDDQYTRQFAYIHIASLYVCASERNLTQYNWATIYWLNGWNSIFNQMTVIKLRIYDRSNNKFIFFCFALSVCLSHTQSGVAVCTIAANNVYMNLGYLIITFFVFVVFRVSVHSLFFCSFCGALHFSKIIYF